MSNSKEIKVKAVIASSNEFTNFAGAVIIDLDKIKIGNLDHKVPVTLFDNTVMGFAEVKKEGDKLVAGMTLPDTPLLRNMMKAHSVYPSIALNNVEIVDGKISGNLYSVAIGINNADPSIPPIKFDENGG